MDTLSFEDWERLDDRSTQVVLRGVSHEQLAIALAPVSDSFKDHIYRNMSERAVGVLKSDMTEKSPVAETDSATKQREIEAVMEHYRAAGELQFR